MKSQRISRKRQTANLKKTETVNSEEGLKKEIETPEECGSIDNYEEKTTSDEEEHSEKF